MKKISASETRDLKPVVIRYGVKELTLDTRGAPEEVSGMLTPRHC